MPNHGATVGWYDVTALPGQAGNALLGGHFDWDGSLAVFSRLAELRAGDRIELRAGTDSALVYAVESTVILHEDRPLSEFMGTDDGSTLTLFTCGGEFDGERGENEQRVVVRATLLDTAPLALRR